MNARSNNPFPHFLAAVLLGGLAWQIYPWCSDEMLFFPWLFVIFSGLSFLVSIKLLLLFVIPQFWRYSRIKRVNNRVGSAGWSGPKEMRKARFHKREGYFCGTYNRRAVFASVETNLLVLGPAGSGKSTVFVIPNLLHNPMSMIVIDLKATLAAVTAKARGSFLKNKIFCLDPTGKVEAILGPSARYNLLQILIDDWDNVHRHASLISDAKAIAHQLVPEPSQHSENRYFREGTRKFLIFSFVYLVTQKDSPTLTDAFVLLSDKEELSVALYEACSVNILNGDLALRAKDILIKLDEGDTKQIESFREGAMQALDEFSPSGNLSAISGVSDFRFADLKDPNAATTVYIIADPTDQKSYSSWMGLLSWCAFTELLRSKQRAPVCFMGDEITNFKVDILPSLLTTAREFKIMLCLVVQELEEWVKTYGRESLETLISQTEAKLILGASNPKTCTLISEMLGEKPQMHLNHNLGQSFFSPLTRSLSEGGRKLMTPDEVRRCDKAIFFYRKMKPVLLEPMSYHKVSPWKHRADINPKFGKKFRAWTRLRV